MNSSVDFNSRMIGKQIMDGESVKSPVLEKNNEHDGFLGTSDEVNIIIIEDEWEYSDSIRDTLEEESYIVEESPEANEALNMMKKKIYDVALIDIILPDMSGIQLLEKIKEISPHTIPIMMTAFASVETAVEALRLGAIAYLYKPVNMDELLIYIKKAYNQRKSIKKCKQKSSILENQASAVIVTSSGGTIVYCNKYSQKLFLYAPEELPGKNIKILFPRAKKWGSDVGKLANSLLKENEGIAYPFDRRGKQVRCYVSVSRILERIDSIEYIWNFMKPGKSIEKAEIS